MHEWLPSPSAHLLWVAAGLIIYVASTRIGHIRRPPASAIAWVVGLILVPYLWLPLFLVFGQRKLKVASRPVAGSASDAPMHWAAELICGFGLPAPVPTAVRFHADGGEALDALWEIIEGARERLDVSTFLVANDHIGRQLIQRLARRAHAGVQVRLLVDGAGTWMVRHPSFGPLRRAGGQIALFHPLLGLRPHGPRNLRNHRKFVVADGTRLWTGGRNFSAEYFRGDAARPEPWIDLSFDLRGGVAVAAARQFELDWTHQHGLPNALPADAGAADGSPAQFVPSGPDQPEDTAHALLVAACFQAKRRLLAVTPYFVPDESLLTALRLAARRGVHVTLVLPAVSNHRFADFVRGRALRDLATAGADIRVVPQMMHAKAVVVDEDLAISGSVNLDARSLLINYEAQVAFYGAAEIRWLAQWTEALAARAVPWRNEPVGLWREIAEGLLLTLAFQL
jgi:cardiolipin synthase